VRENIFVSKKDLVATGSNIASMILIAILIWQSIMLQSQLETQQKQTAILERQFAEKDRPWISILEFSEYSENKIQYRYTNFGNIPNTNGTVLVKAAQFPFTKNDLQSTGEQGTKIGVILPNQHKNHQILASTDLILKAKSGEAPLYFGILIKYDYLEGKHGEFGAIVQYSTNVKDFIILDNWAS